MSENDRWFATFTIAGWLLYPKHSTKRELSVRALQFERALSYIDNWPIQNTSPAIKKAFIDFLGVSGLVEVINTAPRPKSIRAWLGFSGKNKSSKATTYRQPKLWNVFMYSLIYLVYDTPITGVSRQKDFAPDSLELLRKMFISPKGKHVGNKVIEGDCSRYKKLMPLIFGLFFGIRIQTKCNLFSFRKDRELTIDDIHTHLPTILHLGAWYSQHWDRKRHKAEKFVRLAESAPPIPEDWMEIIRGDIKALNLELLSLISHDNNLLNLPAQPQNAAYYMLTKHKKA